MTSVFIRQQVRGEGWWRHQIRLEAIVPHGEAISTGFVESTVNQVISKRFVKKQQMRWFRAHLLLQVRTLVLNGELRDKFQQWHPGLAAVNLSQSL